MKSIRLALALTLLSAVLVSSLCCPVYAAPDQRITYLGDGSYYVTTITIFPSAQISRAASSISGQKTQDYYSSGSHEKIFSISVIGSFTYTGSSATATSADYDYSILDPTWSFISGSASCSGASATANATFRNLSRQYASVTLTCSADGKLS